MRRSDQPIFTTLLIACVLLPACGDCGAETTAPAVDGSAPPIESASAPPAAESAEAEVMPVPRCPPDMVKVTPAGAGIGGGPPLEKSYCVDRYEAMLVDDATSARVPPYYAPSRKSASQAARTWESMRFQMGDEEAQQIPLPTLPAWMLQRDFQPRAVVRKNVTPNGHVSGEQAVVACGTARKRLCTWREWRTACGGEKGLQFPYGDTYVQGECNVFREAHPAAVLHGDASIGHSDPRLNRVKFNGKPLLRPGGATPNCASRWGDDAIYDMVGNVDEWLSDAEGSFAGGFYARATKDGCDWLGTAHDIDYADYSTGVRCCADLPQTVRR